MNNFSLHKFAEYMKDKDVLTTSISFVIAGMMKKIIEKQIHHRAVKTEAVVYSMTDLDSLIICNHSSTTKTFFGNLTRRS